MNGKNVQGSRLSWKETLSFSSGEMGTNLLFAVTSAYLLVYYTNYAQINPAIVGTIMLISKIFDAVSDVAMGYIEERFAKPHAKARPWIKRMVVPYAASALLLFAVPEFNSTALQALYVFLTYNLFCTIYTMIVIPYNSLQALITQNEKDREMTGVLRSVFSTIASTIVNSFTMTFVEAAGNTKQSWLIVIGAYAVIALAVYVLCYKNTTERVVETKSAEGKEEKLGLKQSLQYVLENKYWWILTINGIVSSAVIALNMGSMFYYLAYVCQKPQSVAVVGMILSMPMLFLIPLSKPIVAKIGMKNGLVAGVLIMALGRVVVGLGGSASLSAIYLGSILFAVGCSTQWCSYPLLCNTVEYGEWKNGHRQGIAILPKDEHELANREIDALRIKCHSGKQLVNTLSGGNKQKVSFAKWYAKGSDVIIMDCPTRGVDIGVKQSMYMLIEQMKKEGKAILMISEELSELVGMADKILIMKNFEVTKEFMRSPDLKQTDIIEYMI